MRRTIEQELEERGYGLFHTVGDSMEPILHNRRSTVVIGRADGTLRKYDVALYRRPAGEYVLHRVIRVLDGAYLICGDNRTWRERVPAEWVIGVMTGYYEDERNVLISCEDRGYRRYLRTLPIRYGALWIRSFLRRLRRKAASLWKPKNLQ